MAPDEGLGLAPPLQILREACDRFGYGFRLVDTWSHRLVEVSEGHRSFLAGTDRISVYPLNSAVAVAVAQDKAHTYQRLRQCGFGIPRTGHFFVTEEHRDARPPGREIEDGLRFASELGYPVFVKPNQGSFARNAGPIYDEAELLSAFERIARKDYSAIVQEFLSLPEYRVFMLDGEVRFAYRKSRGTIIGDGVSTIAMLIGESQTLPSPFLQRSLCQRELTQESVLALGEPLEVTPVANLAAGGRIHEFYEAVPGSVREWANGIARAIGLRLVGVDAFFPEGLDHPEGALVLDVNGSPTLTSVYHSGRRELALAVWRDIIVAEFTRKSALQAGL